MRFILSPDYDAGMQMQWLPPLNPAGNAIKMAYLCHAQTKEIKPGDVILFYRSGDVRAITSIGVAETYETLSDADEIAARVKRRTVYSMPEIQEIAKKPTRVLLFRLIKHLSKPLSQEWLGLHHILNGAPQSIVRIDNNSFERILSDGK